MTNMITQTISYPPYKVMMLFIPDGTRKQVPSVSFLEDVKMCSNLNKNSDNYYTVYYLEFETN